MVDAFLFFLAGSALGVTSAYLDGRRPSTLGFLVGLYTIALTVCFIVGQATQVEILAFLAPYALLVIAASLWSAGLAIYWTRLARVLICRADRAAVQPTRA